MATFILRRINPEFWQRVQAKAAAEGTTVKAVILRLLTTWLAAAAVVVSMGCGYKNPTQPTIDNPKPGVPARLELGVVLGTNAEGGTGVVSAKVVDAFATALPDQTVRFVTTAGTFSVDAAQTDEKGVARTTVTASDIVTVTATVAGVTAETLVAIQPLVVPPVSPPPPAPQPPPPPPPTFPPSPPKPGSYSVVLTATPASVLVGGTSILSATVNRADDAPAPSSYTWDCGTGAPITTTAGASQACSYPTAGAVTARLVVIGGTVTGSSTTTVTVTTPPPPPPPALTATLTKNAASVDVGGTLTFTATVTKLSVGETITAIEWDLDGTAGYEATSVPVSMPTSRTSAPPYATAGIYTAKVLVTTSTRTVTASTGFVVTTP